LAFHAQKTDAGGSEYRRHVKRSRWRQIWVTIVFTIASLFLSSEMDPAAARGPGAIALILVCLGASLVGYIIYTIVSSFRLQEFMNRRVEKALQLSFGLGIPAARNPAMSAR
jgi:hypothetical protein